MIGYSSNSGIPNSNDVRKTEMKTSETVSTAIKEGSQTNEASKETEKNKTVSGEKKDISLFIPDGWHILERTKGDLEKVEGDLNKDGINDVAFVIEGISKSKDEAPPRALLIAFGTKDPTYNLSIKSENAILRADEGGVWGDPFEGISIDRGSLVINFYGGSNFRWYGKYRFRYQDNDWYLIGATIGDYYTGTMTLENANEDDYNLLTGDFISRKTDEKEPTNTHTTKGNRGKKELLKLKDFIADEKNNF